MNRPESGASASDIAWIAISGVGIGWMTGLSLSPVLESILAPVLTLAVTGAAILSGLQIENKNIPKVKDLKPVAVLIACIAVGATIGMFTRAYSSYWPTKPSDTTEDRSEIALGLFSSPGVGDVCNILIANFNEPMVAMQLAEDHGQLTEIDKDIIISLLKNKDTGKETMREICKKRQLR